MRKYVAFLILVFGLAVGIAIQDKRALEESASKAANHAHSATLDEPNEHPSKNDINKPNWYLDTFYAFFRWPVGTGAWVVVFTLIAIAEQTSQVARSTDSGRNKDRARLSVEPAYEGYADFDDISCMTRNCLARSAVKVIQQGDTKAFNVKGRAVVNLEPTENTKRLASRKMATLHVPDVIGGGDVSVDAVMGYFPLSAENARSVQSRESFIHFYGQITYDDVFGESHRIAFRYIWRPKVQRPFPGDPSVSFITEGEWEMHGKKKDNYAD